MSHHTFCCAHPQQRIDSPEPPARPPVSIDSIFATAALPKDHPHAPKSAQRRKPDVAASSHIIRSPNLAKKITSQFRRRPLKALSSGGQYDADALPMTSSDVVDTLGSDVEETVDTTDYGVALQRCGSVRVLETPLGGNFEEDVRASVLKSLDWLRPLITRPSDFTPSRPESVVDIATRVAVRQDAADALADDPVTASKIPQSESLPSLLARQSRAGSPMRRTQSFLGLGAMLTVPKPRTRTLSSGSSWSASLFRSASLLGKRAPQVDGAVDAISDIKPNGHSTQPGVKPEDEPGADQASRRSDRAHLHTMAISQQLRSMSAMSDDVGEDESLLQPRQIWTFHHRERSDIGGLSMRSAHAGRQPGTVEDAAAVGRVRSPAASSVYSRPSSMGGPEADKKEFALYEVMDPLDGALSDWPLQTSAPPDTTRGTVEAAIGEEIAGTGYNEPSTPLAGHLSDSDITPLKLAANDHSSVRWLSPPDQKNCIQSKNSSSTLTASSKRSRFFERLSPPKRAVKKRRSIFKFLRPGSRKRQLRSVSSPILRAKTSQTSGLYDGSVDDPNLLTVHYELADNPHAGRSASASHLSEQRTDTMSHLAVPEALQRRPSMADYERSLTTTGDDRRRPSTVNLQKLQEVQHDDQRHSSQLRRGLSRAKPLVLGGDKPTGIMAQALEKHQQEKALFRSASKQRESMDARHDRPTPIFSDTLSASASSLPPSSQEGNVGLLDPFTRPDTIASSARSHSAGHLLPPEALAAQPSHYMSTTASFNTAASRRADSTAALLPDLPGPPRPLTKIESALESWSRYPSHSRPDRCGSAGRLDAVLARDFAFGVDPEDVRGSEESETGTLERKKVARTPNKRLPKRRSTVFSGLKNYYSNIFSSSGSNTARNRRSSVSAGGWLANPDLELLPPSTSSEPKHPHHDHHFKRRLQELEQELEAAVHEDVAYVEEEAGKLEHQFMQDVEFVEEEAVKLEEHLRKDVVYVEEEAEKLMHMQHVTQHGQLQAKAKSQLFREDSPFRADALHPLLHLRSNTTVMGPTDEAADDLFANAKTMNAAKRNITLDGAGSEFPAAKKVSRAEAWSATYKECLIRPRSTGSDHAAQSTPLLRIHEAQAAEIVPHALRPVKARSPEQPKRLDPKASIRRFPSVTVVDDREGLSRSVSLISTTIDGGGGAHEAETVGMEPHILEPVKARSPDQPKRLDPKASIRRFPSVTVVDDRKGHSRSVSLVSVKVDGGTIYRSSTNDLIQLIQVREREERDKLLMGVDDGVADCGQTYKQQ
ncbi:hypothetical protein LTR08_003450 [Meristemomyces frigidus]|nr:hypothetical protein LTR08_003450 [Meristemomyces frigidus]